MWWLSKIAFCRGLLVCLALVGLALVGRSAAAEPRWLTAVDGQPVEASLPSAVQDGQLTFQVAGQDQSLAAAEMVSWGAPRESVRPHLLLADGSLLVGDVIAVANDQVTVDTRHLNELTLALDTLAGILLQPPAAADRRDLLAARLVEPLTAAGPLIEDAEADRLILQNGDELAGTLLAMTDSQLTLDTAAGEVEIERASVAAIRFSPAVRAAVRKDRGTALLGLLDGTLLLVEEWSVKEEELQLHVPGQEEWSGESSSLCYIQPLKGRAKYLSDLPVESFLHLPYLSLPWPYQLDRNVSGSRLRAGGRLYAKGIGLHSTSRLTYKVPKSARRFQALAAIDEQAGMRGSVVFRVFLDGQEAFKSGPVRGGDPPVPISIDLAGARQLSLIVDFGERGDEMDRANWLDARLID